MKKHPIALALISNLFVIFSAQADTHPLVNQTAPPCNAASLTNDAFNLSNYKGKVVLLDFWATWCPPCQQSMPYLNDLHKRLNAKGFNVVAINVDENSEEAKQFLSLHPVDYPNALDSKGNCPNAFDVQAMPSSYLIDRQGKVRYVHLGFRNEDKEQLTNRIEQLVAE